MEASGAQVGLALAGRLSQEFEANETAELLIRVGVIHMRQQDQHKLEMRHVPESA